MTSLAPWIAVIALVGADDLRCVEPTAGQPAPSTWLYEQLRRDAYTALDRRQQNYEQLKTPDDITTYQRRMKEIFVQQLGGFPEPTPLNPHVAGRIEKPGYRIEKVIFESQPGHHVTASLYLPSGTGPFPGVLIACGHSRTAKASDYNQRFGIALARHGIAAMCYDPIGQGERSQLIKPDGQPQFAGTTTEHFMVGVGSILVGTSTARYRIWDGMRAIDYLVSRPEIDPKRIGFTGCSGGGTLTSYIMALDPRVACAAPACYLTTFRRLLETIGPQDAEQNVFGQLELGLDQPDYVLLRAPRPTLISSTTSDFFDIRGSWENLREAKRVYTRLDFPERVDLVEAEGTHGVQAANLTAITRWMRRWLLGKDDAVTLPDFPLCTEEELRCTERGQVLLLPGERSVFDLNVEKSKSLAAKRAAARAGQAPDELRRQIRQTAAIRPLDQLPVAEHVKRGTVQRDTYHIDKSVLTAPGRVTLPMLTYHPPKPQREAYLYLHDRGKTGDNGAEGPIEKLVAEGYVVVAIDLSGLGETQPDKVDATLGDWRNYFTAYLLGRSLVGLRAEDALVGGRFVAYYETKNPRPVHLVGVGPLASLAALHAAAVEPQQFASVTVRDLPTAWSEQIGQPPSPSDLPNAVHGALGVYDLPDLLSLVKPK